MTGFSLGIVATVVSAARTLVLVMLVAVTVTVTAKVAAVAVAVAPNGVVLNKNYIILFVFFFSCFVVFFLLLTKLNLICFDIPIWFIIILVLLNSSIYMRITNK